MVEDRVINEALNCRKRLLCTNSSCLALAGSKGYKFLGSVNEESETSTTLEDGLDASHPGFIR